MDLKITSLDKVLQEEVYVEFPNGFTNNFFLDHVYNEESPFWCKTSTTILIEWLIKYMLDNSLKRGQADMTLFIKKNLVDIYSLLILMKLYLELYMIHLLMSLMKK